MKQRQQYCYSLRKAVLLTLFWLSCWEAMLYAVHRSLLPPWLGRWPIFHSSNFGILAGVMAFLIMVPLKDWFGYRFETTDDTFTFIRCVGLLSWPRRQICPWSDVTLLKTQTFSKSSHYVRACQYNVTIPKDLPGYDSLLAEIETRCADVVDTSLPPERKLLDTESLHSIHALLDAGLTIHAIARAREATGLGLEQSKRLVDDLKVNRN